MAESAKLRPGVKRSLTIVWAKMLVELLVIPFIWLNYVIATYWHWHPVSPALFPLSFQRTFPCVIFWLTISTSCYYMYEIGWPPHWEHDVGLSLRTRFSCTFQHKTRKHLGFSSHWVVQGILLFGQKKIGCFFVKKTKLFSTFGTLPAGGRPGCSHKIPCLSKKSKIWCFGSHL